MGERLECGVDRRPVEIVRDAFPNKQRSCTRRITVFDQTMLDEDRCGNVIFSPSPISYHCAPRMRCAGRGPFFKSSASHPAVSTN